MDQKLSCKVKLMTVIDVAITPSLHADGVTDVAM